MNLENLRKSSVVETVKHFWQLELVECKHEVDREKMLNLIRIEDPKEFKQKVRDLLKDRNFAKGKYYDNPTLVWTTGTEKNPNRPCQVQNWILAEINLGCLYTSRINKKMEADLNAVNGNLKRFVERKYAPKYKEFQLDRVPSGSAATVISVARRKPGREGEIELIDGAHRVVSMLYNNMEQSEAYIAKLKDKYL